MSESKTSVALIAALERNLASATDPALRERLQATIDRLRSEQTTSK
jgi:hypothetical protein